MNGAMTDKTDLISKLGLETHIEGGYFCETYRSSEVLKSDRQGSSRNCSTTIYYLLTDDRPIGHFHRNMSDIIHYFQLGAPLTYLLIDPEGTLSTIVMGHDIKAGQHLQLLVPGGYWKASFLATGEYGLISESVSPGFDFRDMELASKEAMQKEFPELWPSIADYVK